MRGRITSLGRQGFYQQAGSMAQTHIPKWDPPHSLWEVGFGHLPPLLPLPSKPPDFGEYPFLYLSTSVTPCLYIWNFWTVLSVSDHIQWPVVNRFWGFFFLASSKMSSKDLPKGWIYVHREIEQILFWYFKLVSSHFWHMYEIQKYALKSVSLQFTVLCFCFSYRVCFWSKLLT